MIFEDRSAVDMQVNEQRSAGNQSITPGIVELSTDPNTKKELPMKLSSTKIVDHRSLLVPYLPQRGIARVAMVLPGAGCSLGCCCSSCGAITK